MISGIHLQCRQFRRLLRAFINSFASRMFAMPTPRPCEAHLDLVRFGHKLPHFADALRHQRKVKLVALGSSSTAGRRQHPAVPAAARDAAAANASSAG
ncbi:hypothetical protein [Bradyrhizobium diazoefficiens]|uniref:hypothetical protein n=1 Tax=Bradyrhizobium diazoefficiens TaxID=1355477 RepID=UPI0038396E6D